MKKYILDFYEIEKWLHYINATSDIAHLRIIGWTHEYRPIYVIEIDYNQNGKNPIIFIEAGAHAREWISPASALGLIEILLTLKNPNGMNSKKPLFLIILTVFRIFLKTI